MITRTGANLALSALLPMTLVLNGCAIHYFDTQSETEHIWGVGHMKMQATDNNEGVRALITETETLGLALGNGTGDQGAYLSVGWQRNQGVKVVDEDTTLRIEWPSADLFSIRVGTEFPQDILQPANGMKINGADAHE